MRIALLAIHVLVCFVAQAQLADTTTREIVLLNNREIAVEKLLLVNPKKLNGIHVSYPANGIKQYQIDSKKINFLNYYDLKARLGLKMDDTPEVYVDRKSYPDKNDLEIDRSFIKSIDYKNGRITVLTKRKNTRTSSLCYGVRIAKSTLMTNFPKPKVIATDKRFIN